MVKRLHKKVVRDFFRNKVQFFTIFFMIFLGVFAFSGIHAYTDGIESSAQRYYEDYHLPDLWAQGSISSEDLDKIQSISGVKEANRALVLSGKKGKVSLEVNVIEKNTVAKMFVEDGVGFSKNKDGFWMDAYLAEAQGWKVGDRISFEIEGQRISGKILGLILTPDHVYSTKDSSQIFPDYSHYGPVYLSASFYQREILHDQMDVPFTTCLIETKANAKNQAVKKALQQQVDSLVSVSDRSTNRSVQGLESELEEGQSYSGMFSGIFLFIAVLSVISTMHRFIKRQRTQMGTLKALGFSQASILWHYLSYGFFVSLAASVLALLLGPQTVGRMFLNMLMESFKIPDVQILIKPVVFVMAIVVVLIITAITYLSGRKILKESASQALRMESPSNQRVSGASLFSRAGIVVRWNVRDLARNKLRTIASLVGVAGCSAIVVCSFGLLDSMEAYLDWSFGTINNYQNKIVLQSDISSEDYDALCDKYGSFSSQNAAIEFKQGSKTINQVLTIDDTDGKLTFTDHDRQAMSLPSMGIVLTEKLAKKYNISLGDTIQWRSIGETDWHRSRVSDFYRDPQSQQFAMSRKAYENLGLTYRPDSLYTNQSAKKAKGVSSVVSIQQIRKESEQMLETMRATMILLIILSIILDAVVLYNLGLLSFSEKQTQFATLKVLGFSNAKIRKMFVQQNRWIVMAGIVIGMPLGYGLTYYIYTQALGDTYDLIASVRLMSYVIGALGTFGFSALVNRFLARKINAIDMVTSLKGNE